MDVIIWSKEADSVLSVGSPLWDIGIHNWALSRDEAKTAILKLLDFGIPISGGEVYKIVDNSFDLTYDNWFYSRKMTETDLEYLRNSVDKALRYIDNYPDSNAFFAVVPETKSIMDIVIWSKEADSVLSVGSPLWDIGIHNWALSRDEAKTAILKLLDFGIPILGGEVYKTVNGNFDLTYDNWYYDRKTTETDLEYLRNSVDKALKYINNYPDSNAFFAVVPKKT